MKPGYPWNDDEETPEDKKRREMKLPEDWKDKIECHAMLEVA